MSQFTSITVNSEVRRWLGPSLRDVKSENGLSELHMHINIRGLMYTGHLAVLHNVRFPENSETPCYFNQVEPRVERRKIERMKKAVREGKYLNF